MVNKKIRFIDSNYNTLFYIKDGEKIIITYPDKTTVIKQCMYVDEYHLRLENSCFHICEFAEKMEQNKATYQPYKKEENV